MSTDIRLFDPRHGCAACVPRIEGLDDALSELSAPIGSLHRGRRIPWNELRAGSLYDINALACSMAIETWLAHLDGSIPTLVWRRICWEAGSLPDIESALRRRQPGLSVLPQLTCPKRHYPFAASDQAPMPTASNENVSANCQLQSCDTCCQSSSKPQGTRSSSLRLNPGSQIGCAERCSTNNIDQSKKAAGNQPASTVSATHYAATTCETQNGGGGNRTRICVDGSYESNTTSVNDHSIVSILSALQWHEHSPDVAD